MSFESLSVEKWLLPNNIELHGVREGKGPTLIFIHGAMGDWRSWEPQWRAFTEHFDCISYSRRFSFPNQNHQASPHHSAIDEAEDLKHLLDLLKIDRAILVGNRTLGKASMQRIFPLDDDNQEFLKLTLEKFYKKVDDWTKEQ